MTTEATALVPVRLGESPRRTIKASELIDLLKSMPGDPPMTIIGEDGWMHMTLAHVRYGILGGSDVPSLAIDSTIAPLDKVPPARSEWAGPGEPMLLNDSSTTKPE